MNFHVLTVFPEMIESGASFGVVGQACKQGLIRVSALSPRVFTKNVHQTVDDRPFGGGDGMVMLAEPMALALESLLKGISPQSRKRVIHLSPRGKVFSDQMARELASSFDDIILVASRYGGVDQRFINQYVDEEISVGDYVLTGGELPALLIIDAVSRLLPGVLGNELSPAEESFAQGLLEHPQFTRPRNWRGKEIPNILLSGHHAQINEWKKALSILVTADRRPELIRSLPPSDRKLARRIWDSMSETEREVCGLSQLAGDRLLEGLEEK